MKILGIEFAPLKIPIERRLQTLGVLHYTTCFLFFGFPMLFFCLYLLLFTSYWYLPLLYLAWYLYDKPISGRGGRRSESLRRWSFLRHLANYYPVELVKTHELHPSKNYIFACHPHGVLCHSHFVNFSTEGTYFSDTFPGIKPYLCVLAGQFMFPIFREYFLMTGAIEVSKESLEWALTKEGTGNALAIMIGGASEALEAHPGNCKLLLKRRKGFCRLAIKHGASIVPVYAFGENNLYDQMPNPQGSKVRAVQSFLTRHFGFSPPFFRGRGIFNYTFGLLPFRKPVFTVVGAPIDNERVPEPSPEQVDNLHKQYCEALVELFETHKLKYGMSENHHLELE